MSQENYLYYLEKALTSFKNKDYDTALSLLDEALQYNYDVPQLHFLMGKIYAKELTTERLKMAVISFSQAIELKPDYEEAFFERGKIYLQTEQIEEAIQDLEKATNLNPSNKEAYVLLAQGYLSKGETQKALDLLKGISSDQNIDFYIQMGKILIGVGDYDQALKYLEKGKEIDRNFVILYELSAKAYEGLKNYIKAVQELEKAAYLNPSQDQYFKQIATDLLKQAEEEYKKQNLKKAAKYIAMAIDIDYDVPLESKHRQILKEAVSSCILENKNKEALSFIDCIERIAQYDPQLKELKKKAVKGLPLKDKIMRFLTDIYTK
ncbi:MAG: tetratricopeptide repeat protein [Aquificae bacterium]|nr:tetratricopeptide repeat protein [Aquificota bacterium]